MAEQSMLRGIVEFFQDLGVYDIVLPFLLVFTIVFAILEKTRVLGMEEIAGKKYTKKNLNAIVSFVIAFLVIASTRLVSVINKALADIVLLLLLVIFFLTLVGAFFKEEGGVFLEKGGWRSLFMVIVFAGIVLIFLNALGWLSSFWIFLVNNYESRWVGSLILIILIILFMWYITKNREEKPKPKE